MSPSPRSDSSRSSWASCLLPKKRSYDEMEADKQAAEYDLLMGIMQHVDSYPGDLSLMHSHRLRLQQRHAESKVSHGRFGSTFQHFGTMSQLDEEALAKWVLNHSNLTLEDMTSAKADDKQVVYNLFSVATQIPLTWQTAQVLRNIKIFLDFAEWRNEVCGKRLKDIKAHLS